MSIMTDRENASRTMPPDAALATLLGAIGEDRFGPALARFLNELCGADHFAAFRLGNDELGEVAACCVEPERTAECLGVAAGRQCRGAAFRREAPAVHRILRRPAGR